MQDHAVKMIDWANKAWEMFESYPTLMAPKLWVRCAQQPHAAFFWPDAHK